MTRKQNNQGKRERGETRRVTSIRLDQGERRLLAELAGREGVSGGELMRRLLYQRAGETQARALAV